MKEQRFSVSMCVYGKDQPEWFEAAVESVLHQTVKPSEIVLVVDGPVPEALECVIHKYEQNDLFRVIRFESNQGHGKARRAGLAACSYELVALMDADDICMEHRFEQQLEMFANHEVEIVGGDILEFIGTPENLVAARKVPVTDAEIKEYLKDRCPFNQMTVMFKKGSVEKAGGYLDWYCEEDYYLWIRMMLQGCEMMNTGTPLVWVRIGEEMYGRRGGIKYFKSEARLQKYMLDHKVIGVKAYGVNVLKRLIVQVLLPNKLRGWAFRRFARKKV